MTEIEELIEAARAELKKWRLPKQEEKLTNRSWQEIMDERSYPNIDKRNL